MKKRLFCLLAALLVLVPIEALAASGTLVVNTESSSGSVSTRDVLPGDERTEDGAILRPMRCYTDEETGELVMMNELFLPEEEDSEMRLAAAAHTPVVGETRSVSVAGRVECIYVGAHCSIWQRPADDAAVRMTVSAAKQLADVFDAHYDEMQSAFGAVTSYGSDDRLAVYCYDIDGDYPTPMANVPFTAGFFSGGSSVYIDTYPLMGRIDGLWQRIERSYGTLFHEYQHLINSRYCNMPTYLNEAFSMAAEHLMLGAEATADRVAYFSLDPNYIPGSPLTSWKSELSCYANSYLFGQYLRTRYGQLTLTDGSAIYKELILCGRSDYLGYAAELLGTTKPQLLCDFWTAVCLKEPDGPYGFAGEAWADAISMRMESDASLGGTIGAGGARLYAPSVSVSTGLTVLPLVAPGTAPYYRVTSRTDSSLSVAAYPGGGDTLYLALYDEWGKMVACRAARVSAARAEQSVTFDELPQYTLYKLFLTAQSRPLRIENR